MTVKLNRICIYPKDVQRITGKSEKSGRRLLKKIREQLGKDKHQFITTEEFASYTDIAPELMQQYLTDWNKANNHFLVSKKQALISLNLYQNAVILCDLILTMEIIHW